MNNFWLGKVVDSFLYNFDGDKVEVVKCIDSNKTLYYCENFKGSFYSLDALLISWIARKHLGLNQHALTAGICKALNVKFEE